MLAAPGTTVGTIGSVSAGAGGASTAPRERSTRNGNNIPANFRISYLYFSPTVPPAVSTYPESERTFPHTGPTLEP